MISESHYNSHKYLFWRSTVLFLLALVLFTLTMLFRRADSFTNPQFWAEDGMVFFMEQDHHEEFIPFHNYNGYIHLLPRTVAYIAKMISLPYESVPAFYNYATLAICFFYFWLLWRFIPSSSFTKFCMIVCLGILPLAPEVFMNLTNVQWFSALVLLILLFKFRSRRLSDKIVLMMGVMLAGLTGPFSVMFAPLFLFRLWMERRSGFNAFVLIITLITGLIQLIFLYIHFKGRLFPALPVPQQHLGVMFYNTLKQVFFLDHRLIAEFRLRHWLLILPFALLYMILLLNDIRKKRETRSLILICVALNFIFTIAINWPYEWLMSPFLGGMRYFFIPFASCSWYVLISMKNRSMIQFVFLVLLATLFFAHGKWVRNTFVDMHWKNEVKEYNEKEELIAPINPPGWYVIFKQKK